MARTPTETYVDPSIAGNSGAGTIGDPYGDLQHALDTITRDATDGDRINVLAGTDEILGATLSIATYGTPTQAAPLIIQGYTSSAGDGGQGGIDGNGGAYTIFGTGSEDAVHFIHMHLHNVGGSRLLHLDDFCTVSHCDIETNTGANHGVQIGNHCVILHNTIRNVGDSGLTTNGGVDNYIAFNYIESGSGAQEMGEGITLINGSGGAGDVVYRNIIDVDGATDGIRCDGAGSHVINNSIFSAGGTGTGLNINSSQHWGNILNNLVEGFSGAGGIGIDGSAANATLAVYGGNSYYDNETDENLTNTLIVHDLGGNESLSASPFTDAANADFSPVDTGSVKEGSLPASFGDSV